MEKEDLASKDHKVMTRLISMDDTIDDILFLPSQVHCPGAMPNIGFVSDIGHVAISIG